MRRSLRSPAADRKLRVLQATRPGPEMNPYIAQLVDTLSSEITVYFFTWSRALFGRYDIFHAHWPERLVRGSTRTRSLTKQLRFILLMIRLRLLGVPIVSTVHNVTPHDEGGRAEPLLLAWFRRWTALSIRLNDATPTPAPDRAVTIPHGHYVDWYARYPVGESVRSRLLHVGRVRPYKGVGELLAAFGRLDSPDATLRIVGSPTSSALAAEVRQACAEDPRITCALEFVDDATIAAEIGAAELVVLPYRDMHNSGIVLLALSLGRPVLIPRTDSVADLAAEVGPGWVLYYDPPLTTKVLADALAEVQNLGMAGEAGSAARSDRPDLSARDWPRLGALHLQAYRRAIGRRYS